MSLRADVRRKTAAPMFAALGDETRLRLIARLCSLGPQSISQLSEGFDVTRQGVTKHLHVLADAGLIQTRRIGRESIWELERKRLVEVQRCLHQISAQWDGGLDRRKATAESNT